MPKVAKVVSIDRPKYVKAAAVAAYYGVSEYTILRKARSGELPARQFKNGGRSLWFFDLAEVDAALQNGYTSAQRVG